MTHDDLYDALCGTYGYKIRGLRDKNYRTIATTNTLLDLCNVPFFNMDVTSMYPGGLIELFTSLDENCASKSLVNLLPHPKHVMLNGDYTTIVWEDKTSTVLHLKDGETYDPEKVILYGILKKMFNNKNADMNKYLKEFFDHIISHNK